MPKDDRKTTEVTEDTRHECFCRRERSLVGDRDSPAPATERTNDSKDVVIAGRRLRMDRSHVIEEDANKGSVEHVGPDARADQRSAPQLATLRIQRNKLLYLLQHARPIMPLCNLLARRFCGRMTSDSSAYMEPGNDLSTD